MNSLLSAPVAPLLEELFARAEATDRPLIDEMLGGPEGTMLGGPDGAPDSALAAALAAEAADPRGFYARMAHHFLAVSPAFGRLLYACARARGARRIVEFGTSFGISAVHLACALRDGGGGVLITTEFEPAKADAAEAHLLRAGLSEWVEVRRGDARETLVRGTGGPVDMVHLDGAMSLYLPVLELLEPHLTPGAPILAENGSGDYLDYVRDPASPYLSLPMPVDPGRGNELTVYTG